MALSGESFLGETMVTYSNASKVGFAAGDITILVFPIFFFTKHKYKMFQSEKIPGHYSSTENTSQNNNQ